MIVSRLSAINSTRQWASLMLCRRSFGRAEMYSTSSEGANTNTTTKDTIITSWNDYFKLRSKRRRYEIASYVPGLVIPSGYAAGYFLSMEIDPTTTILGMDPVMASVLATAGAGFAGILTAPVFGDLAFKLFNRSVVAEMDDRDKRFYEHIKRNRADARLNSVRNPVPDYYGEKIQSVAGYRAWLRKQREYYRKGVFGGSAQNLEAE